MLIAVLSILALISGALHIRAEYFGPQKHIYLFKPLTMAFIIVMALSLDPISDTYKILILIGLLFSVGGDTFLMLPQDRFVPGLVSFLIAHIFYIVAFAVEGDLPIVLWVAVPLLIFGAGMVAILLPTLGAMKTPVMVYMLVILTMGWMAIGRWIDTEQTGSWLAALGAVLFMASDAVLAYNRFKQPFHLSRLVILGTYFSAQWLIALSIMR